MVVEGAEVEHVGGHEADVVRLLQLAAEVDGEALLELRPRLAQAARLPHLWRECRQRRVAAMLQ